MKFKIIIIGAGFGGIFLAQKLRNYKHEILLIDKENHHVFQPLLYQVACGMLAPENISSPIRSLLKNYKNIKFANEKIISLDRKSKRIQTNLNSFEYEYLVLATGSKYHYFGNDDWQNYSFTLKNLNDALLLKNHIYELFEKAISTTDKDTRKKLLTFTIVGGGPTGVEMAGSLADVFHKLVKDNQSINYSEINIFLLEGAPRLLLNMQEKLSSYTKNALESKGVKVLLNTIVTEITTNLVQAKDLVINTETIIWAAGVKASDTTKLLGIELKKDNKVPVTKFLQLEADPSVFVIGDAAYLEQDSRPIPALAAVAKQQGEYLGKFFSNLESNRYPFSEFYYQDYGTLATIGKNAAIASLPPISFSGFPAWLFWSFLHLFMLIGFRNKLLVFINWFWVYILDKVDSQIIVINRKDSKD